MHRTLTLTLSLSVVSLFYATYVIAFTFFFQLRQRQRQRRRTDERDDLHQKRAAALPPSLGRSVGRWLCLPDLSSFPPP